jgi:EAL domain-containing protein (putative c-di-GMP-specific phosphodiesterase class I)
MDDQTEAGVPPPTPDEVELAAALRQALDDGALTVVYQPLVRSGDGTVLGVEALLRWEMPGRGAIPPSVFIPIAERFGLMVQIGRWVLRTACTQLASWNEAGLGRDLLVHVNLSGPELLDPDLLDTVWRTLSETRVNPSQLCLEVTEPMLRAGGPPAETALHTLEDIGVQLALDDFGTGSSIQALTRFQFDYAKVGRALIGGLDSPMHRGRLIRGLLGMSKALGTTLIAEGIEQGDEIDRIAALGIVKIQGYATGRPATGEEMERLLSGEAAWYHASVG